MDKHSFDFSWFDQSFFYKHLFATVILVLILIAIRLVIGRYIRNADLNWSSHQRLRAFNYLKTGFFVVLTLGMLYIWGEAISGFAVSIFAIAFALVFSVKETFMNLNGAFLRMQGHHYDIGDRISIGEVRGDVIDISLLSTTLMEIGKYNANHQVTGKRIVIPNCMILSEPLINESFLDHYDLIHIKIPLKQTDSWKEAKDMLLQIAKEECASYIEQARIKIRSLERNRSIELPSIEPRIAIQIPEPDLVNLHLRVPCLSHSREKVEQNILMRFLHQYDAIRKGEMTPNNS